MILRLSLFSAFAILACSKPGAGPSTMANGNAGDPCVENPCVGEVEAAQPCAAEPSAAGESASFAGWETWTRKTAARFVSKGHKRKWVDIYVDEAAEPHFDAKEGPYPAGARIVKPQFDSQDAESALSLTVMKKMPAGYDADNGDWYYGVYGTDGTVVTEGKISTCIRCHTQAASQDYVFGRTE